MRCWRSQYESVGGASMRVLEDPVWGCRRSQYEVLEPV
jgi:hypothetical protein